MTLLRQLLAIAALPFVVAVVVPTWIARQYGIVVRVATGPLVVLQVLGVSVLALGLLLFFASLRRFATEGKGTLAPWDPPRRLVVRGPYRYVRNPMISGVLLVLLGESLLLLSRAHLSWAILFFVINAIYIPLLEEPQLAARFGVSYDEYRRHVPRLIPRVRPWEGGSSEPSA
ncbi:MAG TPA: methyltransferase [Gemmatimonadaceae bacterium]|nr:methyltransferase [Gemmatimonadaceae bacterium]